MDEYLTFENCFGLVFELAHKPIVKYECHQNPQNSRLQLEINIVSINNIELSSFLEALNKSIETGIKNIEYQLVDLAPEIISQAIGEYLKELENCRSLVYVAKNFRGVNYFYFVNAKYDDGKNNETYINRIKEINPIIMPNKTSGIPTYRLKNTPVEAYDCKYLWIPTANFAKAYIECLDLIKFKLNILLSLQLAKSVIPIQTSNKYELRITKGFSAKDFVYLFNILSRIGFFEIRENDHEKLYKLLGSIYWSDKGEGANKYSYVKNIWTNSDGDRITKKFCEDFRDKVLKEIGTIVGRDITTKYDSSRKGKRS